MKSLILALLLIASFSLSACEAAQKSGNTEEKIDVAADIMTDLKYLSSDAMRGRETGTAESKTAREYVATRFKESGIEPFGDSYFGEFSFKNRANVEFSGVNVTGFIASTNKAAKYIVISAHYDHVGTREGVVYNGADDNASGIAALIAIAQYFKTQKPQHNLIFVAFDAEEKGLQGARNFVKEPPVPLENIVLNINMDMVSRSEKNELYVAGTYHYPNLKPIIENVIADAPVKLLFGHDRPELKSDDWTNQSDHRIFHSNKIPFVYFGVEDHPDYHKPTDDFEKVDPVFFKNSVKSILSVIKAIDLDLSEAK